ncbi:MAG: hypothetical protein WA624_00715 [Methylocella sp.]
MLELSELDLAIEAAVSVEPLLPIAGNVSHDWQYVLIRIEAWARRGNWDEGLTLCETALSKHRPSPGLALRIARQVRKLLTFNSGALDRLRALLAELGDGGDVSATPLAIVVAEAATEQETALREAIANAEMRQDLTRLVSLFNHLCALKYSANTADRLVDAALPLRKAAQRGSNAQGMAAAEQYLGFGYDLLGDFASAAGAFRAAIAAAPLAGWKLGHLKANLADVVWRQGDVAAAERLFGEARADFEESSDWTQLAVATVKHGWCLVSVGRSAEAVALLNGVADMPAFQRKPSWATACVPLRLSGRSR